MAPKIVKKGFLRDLNLYEIMITGVFDIAELESENVYFEKQLINVYEIIITGIFDLTGFEFEVKIAE